MAAAIALSCSACQCQAEAEPQGIRPEQIYGLELIPTFRLDLDEAAIASLRDEPRDWVHGTLTIDEAVYDDVAVRIKGHRSRRSIDDKPSFKIDTNRYVKGRRILGYRSLTLNNMVEDPTMLREMLAYRLAREVGVPAPQVGYVELSVNGAPYGLYLMVESPDEEFLARVFGDDSGDLFEGEYGCDLYPEDVEGFDRDAGDGERDDLARFAKLAGGPAEALFFADDAPIAAEDLAAFLAFSTFVGDFDGYAHGHNYRIYRNPKTGRWSVLPWGLDRVFTKTLDLYESEGLLAKRCFGDAACRAEYLRALRRVADAARSLDLATGAAVVGTVIADAVERDQRRPYDDEKMARARRKLTESIEARLAAAADDTACLGDGSGEIDADGDGYGCMDCDDAAPGVHPGAAELCGNGIDDDCSGLADDAPECGCAEEVVAGARFAFCDLPMPWWEAAEFCTGLGGELATVDDEAQSVALNDVAKDLRDDRWWIGANDRASEGAFQWADGTPVASPVWDGGEPDNEGCNQDCAALDPEEKGEWHDTHCAQHQPFVCRLDRR